jgi:hypothetical protein
VSSCWRRRRCKCSRSCGRSSRGGGRSVSSCWCRCRCKCSRSCGRSSSSRGGGRGVSSCWRRCRCKCSRSCGSSSRGGGRSVSSCWRRRRCKCSRSCGCGRSSRGGGRGVSSCWRRCRCWTSRRRRRGCRSARRRYPHVVNVFFVLPRTRVEIKSRRIRHISSGVVRNNGDVIAYLVLIRIAFERVERIAHLDVRRPRNAAIRAERIE